MSEIDKFKNMVEAFILARDMTPTSFGKKYVGDPLFVFQLREGREPRVKTRKRVLDAIKSDDGAAA